MRKEHISVLTTQSLATNYHIPSQSSIETTGIDIAPLVDTLAILHRLTICMQNNHVLPS